MPKVTPHYKASQSLPLNTGGDDRSRTDDFHNAIVALCQLSYVPSVQRMDRDLKEWAEKQGLFRNEEAF